MPDIFLLAADRLQVMPSQCIVLEDSESGIRAAANANMRPFMIPDLKPPSKDIFAVVEQVFPSLHAVASYLSDKGIQVKVIDAIGEGINNIEKYKKNYFR